MHNHNNTHNKNNLATTKNNKRKNTIIPSPTSTTTQACAACKYRRRKCTSDCILAPYFPYDRQSHFLNAYRLFGVSNIVKIVGHLSPTERDLAMHTIIFESNVRFADPVGGCYRIIRELEQQINLAKAELEIVLHHLAICRAASFHNHDDVDHHDMITPILDHLACGDEFREEEFKFETHENITPSNNDSLTESDTFKEDDECLLYIQEHQDLKAAATFTSLTS
ncbi:hypothetical protein CASFOL_024988 [Castilleja foliolosa]|uniref:LOB domain-containing protein n=1 Tax=Castilleja foliolosa TaxID=1961234 RepID=A0ABD3CS47_9LAMI